MLNHPSGHFLSEVNGSLQENASRSEPLIFASYSLVGAVLIFGGLGYLGDRWLMTAPWLLLTGSLTGFLSGIFGVYRVAARPR